MMKIEINKEFTKIVKRKLIQMAEMLRIEVIFVVETIREVQHSRSKWNSNPNLWKIEREILKT